MNRELHYLIENSRALQRSALIARREDRLNDNYNGSYDRGVQTAIKFTAMKVRLGYRMSSVSAFACGFNDEIRNHEGYHIG